MRAQWLVLAVLFLVFSTYSRFLLFPDFAFVDFPTHSNLFVTQKSILAVFCNYSQACSEQ